MGLESVRRGRRGTRRSASSAATSLPNSGFPSHAYVELPQNRSGKSSCRDARLTRRPIHRVARPRQRRGVRSPTGIPSSPLPDRSPATQTRSVRSRRAGGRIRAGRSEGGSHHCKSSTPYEQRLLGLQAQRSAVATARPSPSGSIWFSSSASPPAAAPLRAPAPAAQADQARDIATGSRSPARTPNGSSVSVSAGRAVSAPAVGGPRPGDRLLEQRRLAVPGSAPEARPPGTPRGAT